MSCGGTKYMLQQRMKHRLAFGTLVSDTKQIWYTHEESRDEDGHFCRGAIDEAEHVVVSSGV
jgi:hypothetical protein